MKTIRMFVYTLICSLGLWAQATPVGERIPNVCYDTVEGTQFCTGNQAGNVQVFVFNAGWCGPCNSEMDDVVDLYPQFEGKAVTFASLSGAGWSHGSKVDRQFLQEWKDKHQIPFVVAGKSKDFGKQFGASGTIPFAVVVDKQGNIAQSGFMSASQIARQVHSLLNE